MKLNITDYVFIKCNKQEKWNQNFWDIIQVNLF